MGHRCSAHTLLVGLVYIAIPDEAFVQSPGPEIPGKEPGYDYLHDHYQVGALGHFVLCQFELPDTEIILPEKPLGLYPDHHSHLFHPNAGRLSQFCDIYKGDDLPDPELLFLQLFSGAFYPGIQYSLPPGH